MKDIVITLTPQEASDLDTLLANHISRNFNTASLVSALKALRRAGVKNEYVCFSDDDKTNVVAHIKAGSFVEAAAEAFSHNSEVSVCLKEDYEELLNELDIDSEKDMERCQGH